MSQLQQLAGEMPVAALAASQPSTSGGDTSWLDPIIAKASQKYGVDVGLIKAVIKAESNFNSQAVSHAGAQGLMQLMPATARSLGVNALAAYNWGPGNVDRRPDALPRETRDYLARVKQLYATYTG